MGALDGFAAIVTGASRGIGKGCAGFRWTPRGAGSSSRAASVPPNGRRIRCPARRDGRFRTSSTR